LGTRRKVDVSGLPTRSAEGHHPPIPPQLVWARRVSDEGPALAEGGKPGPKNRVKDEAPPLARRRVGSGLSGFFPWSFLACGGGVSFRVVHLRCPVRFGVVSFLGQCAVRSGSFRGLLVCLARSVAVRGGAQRVCTCGAVPGRCAGQAQRPEPRVVVTQSRVFAQRRSVGPAGREECRRGHGVSSFRSGGSVHHRCMWVRPS